MVGGNGGNQCRQYAGQNAGNLNGYNAVENVGNQVVQNPRIQNDRNQNQIGNDLDEIKEVNVNCILMANLQQASSSETVYMHHPPGFTDSAYSDYVFLLQKSFYGLKQDPELDTTYLLLYVDDIILTTSSTSLLQRIISLLHAEFAMTDVGPLNYFLGISAMRTTSGIFLSQTKYATEILEQAQMLNCNPCRTPIDTEKKLRPEGSRATRRPTSGYYVFLGDNLMTWSSKRHDTLSCSSTEAEYHEVTNAVAETSWIRNLLRDLHTSLFTATLVYCDNVSVVYMSANPVQHQRTKHIEIDIHFVRDKVAAGHVQVLHVPSRFQYAYIFTKGLPYPLFTDFRSSLSVRKTPVLTARA
nr:ribonuclease H-like domain-containing protein [Tanacetum cinerariifolium]